MLVRNLILSIACLFIFGCTTNKSMSGSYSSQVDPDYSFSINKRIAVLPSDKGNELESKYYVNQTVEALKQRGFSEVYSYKDLPLPNKPIDIAVIINVDKKIDTYQYRGADYGLVDSGTTNVNCTAWGNSANCTENKQKTFGVTGYSAKVGVLTGHYFSSNWFNVGNNQKIMSVFSSSYEEGCSDLAVYEFLISQTINRLDFEKPNEHKYTVKMPESYNCSH